ncbi:MAG: hypothetical protein WCI41_00050 [bacterium]
MVKQVNSSTQTEEKKGQVEEIFKDGETVLINGDLHKVNYNFLKNLSNPSDNGKIFRDLGIPDKNQFCEEHYGYTPYSGDFPQTRPGDNKENLRAITRVTKALISRANKLGK